MGAQPISPSLPWAAIHTEGLFPDIQVNLPGCDAAISQDILFGHVPGGLPLSLLLSVVRPLLHHFTFIKARKWYVFRCTVRRFKLPGRYLMPCHPEPGLSSIPIAYTATAKSNPNSSPITGVQNIKVGAGTKARGIRHSNFSCIEPWGRQGNLDTDNREAYISDANLVAGCDAPQLWPFTAGYLWNHSANRLLTRNVMTVQVMKQNCLCQSIHIRRNTMLG